MTVDTGYNPRPARVRVPLCPPSWSFVAATKAGAWNRVHPRHGERLVQRLAVELGIPASNIQLCASGTDALTRALVETQQASGGDVVMCTFNCPAVISSAMSAGMRPVLCDITRELRLDPQVVEDAMTPRTSAVVVSHLFGRDAGIEPIARLCSERGIALVDDAAQALGGRTAGRALGTWGDAGVLSFGRHKPLYAGRGGAIVRAGARGDAVELVASRGSDRWHAARALAVARLQRLDDRIPRALGLTGPLAADVAIDLERTEIVVEHGEMPDFDAGLAVSGFRHWADDIERSATHQARLTAVVDRWPERVSLPCADDVSGPVNLFPLLCHGISRRELATRLARRGVETTWLYFPLHLVQRYARVSRCEPAPIAEQLAANVLCVPVRASVGERRIEHLTAVLDEAIGQCNPSRRTTI